MTKLDTQAFGVLLRSRGKHMSRAKYQRPEVYLTGKREKLWKAEYREYYTDQHGKEQSRHKSATWSRGKFTKAEAQAACDALIRGIQQGGPKADGSMVLEAFWDEVFYPIRSRVWSFNTRCLIRSSWRNYIRPAFGTMPLKDINK